MLRKFENGILNTIKTMLGLETDYNAFDIDVIVAINSAFMSLNQLGVGPERGFRIVDGSELWTDFIGDTKLLGSVQTYVYLRTKLVFDPPSTSFVLSAMQDEIKELGWRLNAQVERKEVSDDSLETRPEPDGDESIGA